MRRQLKAGRSANSTHDGGRRALTTTDLLAAARVDLRYGESRAVQHEFHVGTEYAYPQFKLLISIGLNARPYW